MVFLVINIILFALIALSCIGLACYAWFRHRTWDKVIATITDVVSSQRWAQQGSVTLYYPIVSYFHGDKIYDDIEVNYGTRHFRTGNRINLHVNPDNPTETFIMRSVGVLLFTGTLFSRCDGSCYCPLEVSMIFALFIAIFGGTFCFVSVKFLIASIKHKQKQNRCVEVEGQIVALLEQQSREHGHFHKVYFPLVRYTYNDATYEKSIPYGSSDYKIRQTLTLKVNPNDPEEIYIPQSSNTAFLVLALLLFGGLYGVGVIALLMF